MVTIRRLSPNDIDALYSFYRTMPLEVRRYFQPFPQLTQHVIMSHVEDVTGEIAVAYCAVGGTRIIGHAFVTSLSAPHPVLGIGLLPEFQGIGIGTLLMERTLAEVDQRTTANIILTVLKSNTKAIRIYEKFGFRVAAQHTFRTPRDSFVMERKKKEDKTFKIIVYVPKDDTERVKNAMFEAGAGRYQLYDSCAWQTEGTGQFRGLDGSNPAIGTAGKVERVEEYRIEMNCSEKHLSDVVEACRQAHPYEEPPIDVFERADIGM